MTEPSAISLTVNEVHQLAKECLLTNGCDEANAQAVATTVSRAEQDHAHSHGLFRIPGYINSLRSGKVNGAADPKADLIAASVVRMDGDRGFTPLALERGVPILADTAKKSGIAILTISHTYHFAALWPEVEAIAEQGLVGIACTTATPMVAPAGATTAFFGTNPLAFAWPRPGQRPVVYDLATASRAMGDTKIAARDGHSVPIGTGLDAAGDPTTDPNEIVNGGVLLPFGGYKGSAISLMVELLTAGLVGECFSYEAGEVDNGDGGPPRGGEFLLAMDPNIIAPDGWAQHSEEFFARLTALGGVRLPGQRRHKNRADSDPRTVNAQLVETIRGLFK